MKRTYERILAKNDFYKFEVDLGNASIAKLESELKKYPNDSNERRLTLDIIKGIERQIKVLQAKIIKYM